ncbi:hypothetical protein [Geomicrobium sp. JCM 19039]|uniref:hypothetical protein n=1 Tax=Geomicrobium sp. JCM 19039 TaxID=1460636 RepID=UPI00045F3F3F|nr:hypothetical protein [Geomicrobium sp. JCM 19039]GAK13106.1 hypothetical protein JCM19039_2925 [Geomicrobium sp. JCM 19039]
MQKTIRQASITVTFNFEEPQDGNVIVEMITPESREWGQIELRENVYHLPLNQRAETMFRLRVDGGVYDGQYSREYILENI